VFSLAKEKFLNSTSAYWKKYPARG